MKAQTRWWLLTVATALACALTVSLGFWQLSRAAQKTALSQAMSAQAGATELSADTLVAAKDTTALLHQPARLSGEWLADHTVFLDNRQMRDRVGFYVVTPLKLHSGAVVLVYRGWVARNFLDRAALPVVVTPAGAVAVQGRIAPQPGKLYEPGTPSRTTIRQNLDIALFAEETRLPLLNVVLMQGGNQDEGLLREWPVINLGVDKHYGYAAQWFGIAALIVALYAWFQWIQPYIRRTKESEPHVQ